MPRDRRYNFHEGGSVASASYDNTPSQAPIDLSYPHTKTCRLNADEIVKNYGSVYNTTGGGLSDKVYEFTNKFIDNRVLDLYLKYLGITYHKPSE